MFKIQNIHNFFCTNQKGNHKKKDKNGSDKITKISYKINFNWIKDLFKIDKYFIKNYDKDSDKAHILQVDVKYPKNLHDLHSDLPFLPERMKIDKCNKLIWNLFDKKTMLFI